VNSEIPAALRRYDRLAELAKEIGGLAVGRDLLDSVQVGDVVLKVTTELGEPEILINVLINVAGNTSPPSLPSASRSMRSGRRSS
jgi:NADP-dependent 3-hydroxy acid dehydrogenase YdfG